MCGVENMNIKIGMLAALVLAALPFSVKAQEVNSYDNYRVACESGAECNDFNVDYEQADGSSEISQTRRTRRTRRTRSSSDFKKIYVGGTLGLFFPSEIEDFRINVTSGDTNDLQSVDPGTGFGGSLYGGYKFSDFISADIEGFVFGGDSDPLDSSYTSYGFFVNPRFTYAFNQGDSKSPYGFVSPGLGIAGVDFGDEIGNAQGVQEDSGTGFALQLKGGVGYPISDSLDIIGQARYFNAFNVIETTQFGQAGEGSETDDQGFSAFSVEAGVNFKF